MPREANFNRVIVPRRAMLAVWIAVALSSVVAHGQQPDVEKDDGWRAAGGKAAAVPKDIERILWWLPADSESIIVVRGPFDGLPETGNSTGDAKRPGTTKSGRVVFERAIVDGREVDIERTVEEGASPEEMDFKHAMANLTALLLQGNGVDIPQIELLVTSSRHFGTESPIPGMKPYAGCHLALLNEPVPGDVWDALQKSEPKAFVEKIEGHRIIGVPTDEDWLDGKLTLYFARPQSRVVLVATDRSYLREMLNRMERRSTQRAFASDLPEWEHVDCTQSVWGLRHFDDSKLPGFSELIGLTFFTTNDAEEIALRCVSTSPTRLESLSDVWKGLTGKARTAKSITNDVAEIRGPFEVLASKDRMEYSPFDFAFSIHTLMGFWFGI